MPATLNSFPIYPQFDFEDDTLQGLSNLFDGAWV